MEMYGNECKYYFMPVWLIIPIQNQLQFTSLSPLATKGKRTHTHSVFSYRCLHAPVYSHLHEHEMKLMSNNGLSQQNNT